MIMARICLRCATYCCLFLSSYTRICVAYVTVLHILTAPYNMSVRSHIRAQPKAWKYTRIFDRTIRKSMCVKTHMRYTQAGTILSMTLGLKPEYTSQLCQRLHFFTYTHFAQEKEKEKSQKEARENKKSFNWICSWNCECEWCNFIIKCDRSKQLVLQLISKAFWNWILKNFPSKCHWQQLRVIVFNSNINWLALPHVNDKRDLCFLVVIAAVSVAAVIVSFSLFWVKQKNLRLSLSIDRFTVKNECEHLLSFCFCLCLCCSRTVCVRARPWISYECVCLCVV